MPNSAVTATQPDAAAAKSEQAAGGPVVVTPTAAGDCPTPCHLSLLADGSVTTTTAYAEHPGLLSTATHEDAVARRTRPPRTENQKVDG